MKKTLFFLMMMVLSVGLMAQTEAIFNFNDCIEEEPLNGQQGWFVRPHTAGNGGNPMYTGYIGHFWKGDPAPTMDETMGVFSIASGTGFGDVATHTLDEFGFDFSTVGVIEVECDMYRGLWGHLLGIGFDGNGVGALLPPLAAPWSIGSSPTPSATTPSSLATQPTSTAHLPNAAMSGQVWEPIVPTITVAP